MAFAALKSFLNIKKSNNDPKNLLEVGEPYDFKKKLSIKIDQQNNRLVGLPSEWEETFRLNGIDLTIDSPKLNPIFRSLRNCERKGLTF